jgi:SAM-dependent methyltransferase
MQAAFDATAGHYDSEFTQTITGRLQRMRVWEVLDDLIGAKKPHVLELNCGTGEDACWLAQRGCTVMATDASAGMVQQTAQKATTRGLSKKISTQVLDLQQVVWPEGPQVGLVLSNFGGLNCLDPDQIRHLGTQLKAHVPSGRPVVVVVMGRFCAWESFYFTLKCRLRSASRRWRGGPVAARLDDHTSVATWYYSPDQWQQLWPDWQVRLVRPVGLWLPPSYLSPTLDRWPRLMRVLDGLERRFSPAWSARWADHWLMVLEC